MHTSDTYTLRPARRSDAAAVTELIQAVNVAEIGEPDFSQADLESEWDWDRVELGHNTLIAEADGTIVGYAWMYDRRPNVDFDADVSVHPKFSDRDLTRVLLEGMEKRAGSQIVHAPPGARVTFYMPSESTNGEKIALLESRGYELRRHYFRMEIRLEAEPAEPELPAGITIRSCVKGQDEPVFFRVLHEAFAEHFRHSPSTEEGWIKRHTGYEFFDPNLWFLAYEGERAVGAVANFYFDDLGWVDELGVLAPWRGRGLGRVLLEKTFAGFWKRGQPRVCLGVDARNHTGATQLYERVGMNVTRRMDLYEKVLREPVG